MESILYVVSFALACSGCVLIPKVKRMNAVSAVMLGYVSVMCCGALGALLLKMLTLKVSLKNITAFYFILAAVFWVYIVYKKQIQELQVRLCDMIGLAVGVLIIGFISLHIFTPYVHINYNNMVDPSGHFYYAMQIVRSQSISGMYFTQFHNAMLMQVIMPFLPKSWSYKAFILVDCYHTLIEYYFFYSFIIFMLRKKKYDKYLPILLALLYWFGYPLYSFAGGAYIYWAMGAMLVFYVFWLLKIYEEATEKYVKIVSTLLIILGCFATTMCYVQFAPIVVFATLSVFLYQVMCKQKFHLSRRKIIQCAAIFALGIVVACMGYYFIFYRTGLNLFEGVAIGINTAKNLEMICVLPVIYYIMCNKLKEKKFDAYVLIFLSLCSFHLVMILLSTLEIVSSYYLFKDNYIIWGAVFIIFINECWNFNEKEQRYIKHYAILLSIFLLFMYTPQKQLETTETLNLDNSIYKHNATLFVENDFRHAVADDCINMIEYVEENYDVSMEGEKVAIIGTNWYKGVCHWYSGITGQPYFFQTPIEPETVNNYLQQVDADYILVYYASEAYEMEPEYFETFEKVYDTHEGFIGKVK